MNRPDFSNYLAHFTTTGEPNVADDSANVGLQWKDLSALEKLISILKNKMINATIMPWTFVPAVCFTECPWSSFIAHTQAYSPYGIGFSKAFIYSRHGGPVFYMRPDHFKRQKVQKFDKYVLPFITPFAPKYRPKQMENATIMKTVDYTHEREWRVPHDLLFEYDQIEFIILEKYEDLQMVPEDIIQSIGIEKFLFMDTYKKIETLWPVHRL